MLCPDFPACPFIWVPYLFCHQSSVVRNRSVRGSLVGVLPFVVHHHSLQKRKLIPLSIRTPFGGIPSLLEGPPLKLFAASLSPNSVQDHLSFGFYFFQTRGPGVVSCSLLSLELASLETPPAGSSPLREKIEDNGSFFQYISSPLVLVGYGVAALVGEGVGSVNIAPGKPHGDF